MSAYTFFDFTLSFVYAIFIIGIVSYWRNIYRIKKYSKGLGSNPVSLRKLRILARQKNTPFPKFAILVPARNEGDVIANTIQNLVELSYPKASYSIYIIVDERELQDAVERRTKDIVHSVSSELNARYGKHFIHCVEVPEWYSGILNDTKHTDQKSTKGRALNYALQTLLNDTHSHTIDMIGVLDADGRLHPHVLKEVAYKRLSQNSMLLQGPVFQITNFLQASLTGKIAGLELAIHHLTEVADHLMSGWRFQFLAGTNYFIDKNLIAQVRGWNQHALVEDAELALRIYAQTGITAQWLNWVEQEQTSPSFRIYRKQRERWARGHLHLLAYIRHSRIPRWEKIALSHKILSDQYRVLFDIGLPIFAISLIFFGALRDLSFFFTFLSMVSLAMIIFIWDIYGFTYRTISGFIDPTPSMRNKIKLSIKLFFFTPILIIIQAIPRIEAIINFIFRPNQMEWYKTERTREL